MIKGNKKEFASLLAKKVNISVKEANLFIDGFFDSVEEFIFNSPSRISFSGRMTISLYERKERTYRHPKTKEEIFSPSKKSIRIKIGENWKKKLIDKKE